MTQHSGFVHLSLAHMAVPMGDIGICPIKQKLLGIAVKYPMQVCFNLQHFALSHAVVPHSTVGSKYSVTKHPV